MRLAVGIISVAVAALSASTAYATTAAFEDNKLSLKDCDGAELSIRWNGDNFAISTDGKSIGYSHASFKSVGWDGKCQTVGWDTGKNKFSIDSGAAQTSDMLRFVAQDGAHWIGIRNGDGFFVTRMSQDGKEASAARVSEIAEWLARTSSAFTPGEAMSKHLKVGSAE